jgi:hypothetical protein
MDDAVNVWVFGEDLVQLFFVCNVKFVVLGSATADELYAVEDFCGGIVEVVDNDDVIVGFEKGKGCEGADVACTTKLESVLLLPAEPSQTYPVIKQLPTGIVLAVAVAVAVSVAIRVKVG